MQNVADPIEHANSLYGFLGLEEAREIAADNLEAAWKWDDIMYWFAVVDRLYRIHDVKRTWN